VQDIIKDSISIYKNCNLCPRKCGVDRTAPHMARGFCKEGMELKVAYIGPHYGEEPPISGDMGSGTVFFSGCSLKCCFCQNYQISRLGIGKRMKSEDLLDKIIYMVDTYKVHNVNFVTPDHFLPHVFGIVTGLRNRVLQLPVIFNISGYQSVEMIQQSDEYVDIYLVDFKYSDSSLAKKLSSCEDYPSVALQSISEMIRQKGFLDAVMTDEPIAKKGVVVRHLILPGKIKNSIDALSMLRIEFGPDLPISIMSQYFPVLPQKDRDLNRFVMREEFEEIYEHAMSLGFQHIFIQSHPYDNTETIIRSMPVPDFTKENPFRWDNMDNHSNRIPFSLGKYRMNVENLNASKRKGFCHL